jgi:hypothetical protein
MSHLDPARTTTHLVSLALITSLLETRIRKEESDPSNKSVKNTNKHSLKSLCGWNDFENLESLWSFDLCLGVNALALVLNRNFRKLGCLEWWWLGVFIALNHQRTIGEGCCRWAHRTVWCTSHVTQLLGFWSIWPLEALSSCGTGQSGATPDSYCSLSGAPLTCGSDSARTVLHCSSLYQLLQSTVARRSRCFRWHTGQYGGTLDSLVNYSGARLEKHESGLFNPVRTWRTRHCPVRQTRAHLVSFLLCIWTLSWIFIGLCWTFMHL